MSKKAKRVLRPIADGNYQKQKAEEFLLCRNPGCHNVVAKWIQGSGYCTPCKRRRM